MQDLQDLALNLASLALKIKLFLQELKNLELILQELTRKICKIIFLQDFNHILQVLARSVQDFSILARKASFLVQDLQGLVQDLASL